VKQLSLSDVILATLAYSSVFQHPLTEKELKTRLIGKSGVTQDEINKTLRQMKNVKKKERYFYLLDHESDLTLRKKREHYSKLKQTELSQLISHLKKIPTITSVYVTGSLAMHNVSAVSDDIDILVVTKPRTMWVTRLIVVLWMTALGKYRLHGSSGEWGWCFNLWLDQDHLQIPKNDRSVYLAYEVVQAQLVLGIKNELLAANGWVNEYINSSVGSESSQDYETRTINDTPLSNFFSKLAIISFRLCDTVSYALQRLYMQPRRSREKVGRGFAFFHPRDTKKLIVEQWLKELREIGMEKEKREALLLVFEKGTYDAQRSTAMVIRK
jgi:predicted nucleotidyltransferase